MDADRETKIGCLVIALWILIGLGIPLSEQVGLGVPFVVAIAVLFVCTSLVVGYVYFSGRKDGRPFMGHVWPRSRSDAWTFAKQIGIVSIVFAYLVLIAGMLLIVAARWLTESSASDKMRVVAAVAALAIAGSWRSARKKVNRRRAVMMLKGSRSGIAEWNQWRRRSFVSRLGDPVPDLNGVDLSQTDLAGADFSGMSLQNANLSACDLSEADLENSDLTRANLRDAKLPRFHGPSRLSYADLRGVDLRGTVEPFLLDSNLEKVNLSGQRLPKIVLRGCKLRGADLSRTDLTEADLRSADLAEVDLTDANLTKADLRRASLWKARLTGANLQGADLQHAVLVEANLDRANLSRCTVYGVSVWDSSLVDTVQESLVVNRPDEPSVTVDDIQIAQLVHLMLTNDHVRELIRLVSAKGVLLLGRFGGGGLDTLHSIAAALRKEKYLPMIFDYDRPAQRNYTETVQTLVGLARFVIVDLSGPSVPQELYATVPHFKVPFVPIIEEGRQSAALIADILEYPWVVKPPVRFSSSDQLLTALRPLVIEPAERLVSARRHTLDELMPRTQEA